MLATGTRRAIGVQTVSLRTILSKIFQSDYRSEGFGDYDVPKEILMLEDIEDLSWHNDTAPSFGKLWDEVDQFGGNVQIRIYVEHPDVEQREYYDEMPRMNVVVYTTDCEKEIGDEVQAAVADLVDPGIGDTYDGATTTLLWTDDPMEAVRKFVTAVVAINQVLRRR